MKILILTEGGSEIGLGHISRCSSLYDEIESRGVEVELIINGSIKRNGFAEGKNYRLINWLSEDFLVNHIQDEVYCIVDSYLAGEQLLRTISNLAKYSLFIDDNARIHYPKGLVVNPSLNTETARYQGYDTSCYLIGPQYIILRKPFVYGNKRVGVRSRVKEVLITMGGSNVQELTTRILKTLSDKYPELLFHVVTGNINSIDKGKLKNVYLYKNISAEEMRAIMLRSDLAVTAAGQTIYELISTQTPFIPVKLVENQNNNIAALERSKLVDKVLDCKKSDFISELDDQFKELLSRVRREQIFNEYFDYIDGMGSKRIINKLLCM